VTAVATLKTGEKISSRVVLLTEIALWVDIEDLALAAFEITGVRLKRSEVCEWQQQTHRTHHQRAEGLDAFDHQVFGGRAYLRMPNASGHVQFGRQADEAGVLRLG
jgi:hypothetical protein